MVNRIKLSKTELEHLFSIEVALPLLQRAV